MSVLLPLQSLGNYNTLRMKNILNLQLDMTSGSIAKKTLIFALPVLLSGWLQLLYSAMDLIVCGNFGSNYSVGAITATTSLTHLIISLFMGISVGANVLMAQAFGAKNKDKANKIIGATYALGLLSSVVLLVVGVTCSKFFLEWMGTPQDIIDLSNTYMTIYFIGIPFTIIYNFGAALLRGLGDTTKPFFFLFIAGIINVGLNFLFVITFQMDVAGVATTTVISQFISAFLVTLTLIRNKKSFANLTLKNIRFYKKETISIIRIGVPAGLQSALFSLSNVIIQSSINSFGPNAVSGAGAQSSIESFLATGVDAFAQATVAFVGANYGAMDEKRIKVSIFYTSLYGAIFAIVGGLLCYLFAEPLLRLYISDPEAIAYGVEKMMIVETTYVIYALVCTISSAIRGLGFSFTPMIVSLLGICGVRILYVFTLFPLEQFHSMFGLYIAYPVSWLAALLVHIPCLIFIGRYMFKKIKTAKEKSSAVASI